MINWAMVIYCLGCRFTTQYIPKRLLFMKKDVECNDYNGHTGKCAAE